MKTSKIIATLGVAAALGVSCIPMGAIHAADSASANITLSVASQVTVDWGEMATSGGGSIAHSMDPNQFGVADEKHTIAITNSNNGLYGFDLKVYGDSSNTGTKKNSLHNTAANADIPVVTDTKKLTAGTAGWGLQAANSAPDASSTSWVAPGESSASQALVKEALGKTGGDASVDIYYGFATAADTKSGDYSAKINYTLTARTN